ncbi:putative 2-octaprenylphenol hydroxylase of ubiquinone biosynthetic pathway [Candidatus Promineifilum breve]|uniref:2-octaprenylphenol hydroxylase of ubiquinone biosynthetic pathway n=1 Tax=Candidatus Promineifilum breve TaxID=1806508 RepID=A0A160T561_9CHLR|nr:AarF/UbiB family protein [Candidatus Promineifilum breve]CUS04278.2 putative 2-octaprenylphenol hydroxylase of ubiquinone biosynthetic pathway [Candidatus Promineifilum breve]
MAETSSIDSVRESLRLQQVYNVFVRYGLDILFSHFGMVDGWRRRMQDWVWDLPDNLEIPSLPTKVRLMIEELGPTYVKVGQILSSQASVIPPDWETELARLQSDVPPFPSEQVRETIISELKAPPEQLFATFEPASFAAASTAQVHRATLHDGTEVVVKVQRPDIQKQMKADVGIMINAANVIARRSQALRAIDLPGMVDQFGSNAIRELNYSGEAYNAFRLSQNMAGCPGVHIPHVYTDYSTSRLLTMEFVRGVKISNLAAIDAAGIDRQALAMNTLRALIKQLMFDGFFHADPHPGNLLVNLQTGDVTFIDTGMVGELELAQRLSLIQLLIALQNQDVDATATMLKSLSVPFMGAVDDKAYRKDFQRTLGPYMIGGARLDFSQSLSLSMDVLRRHGLRLDPNLTLAVKALMQVIAMGSLLFPDEDVGQLSVAIIREEALNLVTADNIQNAAGKVAGTALRQVADNLPSLSTATASWLKQYRKGRFEVHVDTSDVAREVDKIAHIGRQAVIAVILVGLIIGSAITTVGVGLGGFDGPGWEFVARIAGLGYILSSIVAGVIVLRLAWRWLRGGDPGAD